MYNVSIDTVGAVEKRIQENRAQKVANLIEQKIAFNPMSQRDSITQGIPITALLGALGGGMYGATEEPGYDENTGEQKSKIKNIILGSILGSGIGAVGGALLPGLASSALYGSGIIQENVLSPASRIVGESSGVANNLREKGQAAKAMAMHGNESSLRTMDYSRLISPV